MKYKVTVWASHEVEIDDENVKSAEEAEEMAVEVSPFPYVDYCETEKIVC